MLVIEQPTIFDEPVPVGTFVVIAVDPIASVSALDEQAKREAAEMTSTKYLAMVDGVRVRIVEDKNTHFHSLFLLRTHQTGRG